MSSRPDRDRVLDHLRGVWESTAELIAWCSRELDLRPSGVDLLLRDLLVTGELERRPVRIDGLVQHEYRTVEHPRPARIARRIKASKAANARGAAMQRERLLAVLEARGVVPLSQLRFLLGYSVTTIRMRAAELAEAEPPRVRIHHRDGDTRWWSGVELVR